jgi:hypothetical protein
MLGEQPLFLCLSVAYLLESMGIANRGWLGFGNGSNDTIYPDRH